MATFTNQFDRTNPYFRPSAFGYFGWLYQLWEEVAQLLRDVPLDKHIAIARQIEALLTKNVEQKQFSQSGAMQRVAQSDLYKDSPIL